MDFLITKQPWNKSPLVVVYYFPSTGRGFVGALRARAGVGGQVCVVWMFGEGGQAYVGWMCAVGAQVGDTHPSPFISGQGWCS